MAPSKSSFLDRLSSPRGSAPLLPFHEKRRRSDDYDLDNLSPRQDDSILSEDPYAAKGRLFLRSPSPADPDPWNERASSTGSSSKLKPHHAFDGPPPPIAASIVIPQRLAPASRSRERRPGKSAMKSSGSSRLGLGSVLFDATSQRQAANPADSTWRALQRREQAIGKELQDLLDMQAMGLVAGSETATSSNASDADAFSDTGSSTPTATFYSTVTSRSRMTASLDHPTRATPRGDVIPIRQPKASKPPGLRAARNGLRRSMTALANLKAEEDAHVEAALSDRKKALVYLQRLTKKQEGISRELHSLADDGEEPLAKELRTLGDQHQALDQEIREMEETLVGMRNRRRWLGRKMDDVKNRREAGLSGYRGAMKEVEGEVSSLMRRPPIEPLDLEVLMTDASERGDEGMTGLPSGEEFLQLIPERRTPALAMEWWQGEINMLEARKNQIDKDREALESGLGLWNDCATLVAGFEANLRKAMKGEPTGKGKEKAASPEEALRQHIAGMAGVIEQLQEYVGIAETNNWNLLICAVGAELEAFEEAERMLRNTLESSDEPTPAPDKLLVEDNTEEQGPAHGEAESNDRSKHEADESDNDVPLDLLVTGREEQNHQEGKRTSGKDHHHEEDESDSGVPPPEFLAEHDPEDGDFHTTSR
ncbi:hypothetical protein D7B24_006107 [Verticillium nonalfalfae]|uniref:Autophagy-related protein 28 n=1 Tax=Verticillium nonalfalfae TaxID=1051616 RepID=A0A3M9YAE6_9PEZI|nr:uncharacterized protein D7B24_006107 [Verticillium nonalfalfae]RNJ57344.1 hypothetical protein D7B24_006107 [Verticillium nonalfalfae]